METLHVGQSGHTSDSERDFISRRMLGRLENEGREALEAGQDWGGGIEKRPMPKIIVGMGHDGCPRWLAQGKDTNQPPALLELLEQAIRHDFGRTIKKDHVIRCICRIPVRRGSSLNRHDRPQPSQSRFGLSGERRITFGRGHLPAELGGQGSHVPTRTTNHQDLVGRPDVGRLQHAGGQRRLDQEALDGRPLTDIEVEIQIGQRALILWERTFPAALQAWRR